MARTSTREGEHDATPSGWVIHYLRELGGLLAIEIEDTLYAIHNRGVVWGRARWLDTRGSSVQWT